MRNRDTEGKTYKREQEEGHNDQVLYLSVLCSVVQYVHIQYGAVWYSRALCNHAWSDGAQCRLQGLVVYRHTKCIRVHLSALCANGQPTLGRQYGL